MADSVAMRAVRKARTSLLTGKPAGRGAFFGHLAMRLELVEDEKLGELMATNGRVLKFNPTMVQKIPDADRPDLMMSAVAHEILHCASHHHLRRGKRDKKLWNIACDHVVNLELKDAGFRVPDESYCDERFKDMAAERAYTILEQEQPPPGSGRGGGKGDGSGQGNSPPMWSGGVEDAESDEPEDGEGDGEGEGQRGLSDAERRAEERKWEQATIQAANAAHQQGTVPGFAQRFIQELHVPKVNPWEVLREFVKETMESDYRWFPPNRRFVSQGLYLPSIRSDDALGAMVVVIDTSGSIDQETLQEFGNHIKAIKEDFRPKKITVIYADAAVNHIDVFEQDDELFVKPHGGGGTDFRPAFKRVIKDQIDTTVLVYLTDLCGTCPEKAPDYPVIWACTTNLVAPFGTTIHIKV